MQALHVDQEHFRFAILVIPLMNDSFLLLNLYSSNWHSSQRRTGKYRSRFAERPQSKDMYLNNLTCRGLPGAMGTTPEFSSPSTCGESCASCRPSPGSGRARQVRVMKVEHAIGNKPRLVNTTYVGPPCCPRKGCQLTVSRLAYL